MAQQSQNLLKSLTQAQKTAVIHETGPALVIAGPGSGKTKVITHRLAYLLKSGIPASGIIALTFTNKAADEMSERVKRLLGLTAQAGARYRPIPFIGTFHALCSRILRSNANEISLPRNFGIIDADESLAFMKEAYKRANIEKAAAEPSTALAVISQFKNECRNVDDISPDKKPKRFWNAIISAWRAYEKLLDETSSVDFDNLLLKTLELFEKSPKTLALWQKKASHILVDEYQDTNRPQYLLIKYLSGLNNNVFVVGDDWQSIYTFRGADFRNILNFQKDWPNAKVYFLEENFRSTRTIVEAASGVIRPNQFRTNKNLFTRNPDGVPVAVVRLTNEMAEAEYIAEEIVSKCRNDKRSFSDFAVFYRTHAQSRAIEEACMSHGIPYRLVGGFKFYKRREVQDLLAYLKYIANPKDIVSLKRIINVPPRGIRKKTIEKLENGNWKLETEELPAALKEFFSLMKKARKLAKKEQPSKLLRWLIKEIGYEKYLCADTETGRIRWENAVELVNVASAFDSKPPDGLYAFLESAALLGEQDEYEPTEDKVTLMTIHASKGLEFPVVFIAGCEEGIFPHARSILDASEMEEERRLAYVAISRAKEEVYLTYAKTRLYFGEIIRNMPSRFLSDIPENLISFTDETIFEENNLEQKIQLD